MVVGYLVSGYTFFKGIHSIYFISDSARVLCSFLIVVSFYNHGIWYFKGQLRHLITSNSKKQYDKTQHALSRFYWILQKVNLVKDSVYDLGGITIHIMDIISP